MMADTTPAFEVSIFCIENRSLFQLSNQTILLSSAIRPRVILRLVSAQLGSSAGAPECNRVEVSIAR